MVCTEGEEKALLCGRIGGDDSSFSSEGKKILCFMLVRSQDADSSPTISGKEKDHRFSNLMPTTERREKDHLSFYNIRRTPILSSWRKKGEDVSLPGRSSLKNGSTFAPDKKKKKEKSLRLFAQVPKNSGDVVCHYSGRGSKKRRKRRYFVTGPQKNRT